MRFRRLRIHAFGNIDGLDTGASPLPDLVVVHGPNEAGKSTFFELLTALLYGFYPASRDSNPYAPWGGRDASGEADIALDGGTSVQVHRRLLSTPAGTLVRDGTSEDLRNRTLPFVDHVPLQVFRQVFALTPGQLAALEGESWARVQDRLVTGMGATDLRPPREVADELEAAAGRLWRPSQRGNQVVRDLGERVRELTVRRRNAAEADRAVRQADRELGELRERLAAARREREACRLYVERYRALLPIRDQLERIRGLEEEAGPAEELAGLPTDPAGRLDELDASRKKLERRLEEIASALDEARERTGAWDGDARALFGARDRVRALVGRVGGLEPVRVRAAQVRRELRDLERRAGTLASELLAQELTEIDREGLGRIVPALVREAVDKVREAGDAVRAAESVQIPDAPDRSAAPVLLPGVGVLAVGLALVGWGVFQGSLAVVAGGAVVMAVGAALLGAGVAGRRRGLADRERERTAAKARQDAARRAAAAARDELKDSVAAAPLRPELLDRPTVDLATRLERLQELVRDVSDRNAEAAELDARVAEVEVAVRTLAEELDLALPEDPAAAAHVLGERLREAERARDVAEMAEGEAGRLERERQELASELEAVRREEDELTTRLEELGGGDPGRGLERARTRNRARERARQLLEELQRGHPDLAEIRERIRQAEEAGEDWAVDDEALARKKAREEDLVHEIEDLVRRVEGLQKEIEHLAGDDTVDEVEGELRALRARIDQVVRERDRMWLLGALLRQADRRFREEHQPDVLRRAGEHLSAVTGGRYERLLVGEDLSSQDATFLLRGPGYPGPMEVGAPVSTGTREQVYLALRLAVLDHLDRGGERLPLVMDEILVNWDRDRRERAFDLLQRVSRERQVFFFTCHGDMARDLADRGGLLISLPGPS